ncbi:MAG TPA: Hsp70 family protein, partial [Aliiroseovarius sp.]|nr:Hsp70 family protein [Aliiroseovarius sp.]
MGAGRRLGVDFGTSNSAAGFHLDGKVRLIEVEPGQNPLPTAFFLDDDSRETLLGSGANAALLEGVEGRYMRALKRVLGTPLMHEERQILNERVTFVEIIARFLRHIKARAESTTGLRFETALSGRPVRFHSDDAARDVQAEADLRACYLAAGFQAVDFLPEPEAAAIATGLASEGRGLGLVVDIGGGTSDFSVFETGAAGQVRVIANRGVTIGGTDFDRLLSLDHVMGLLGKDAQLRREFGPGWLNAPKAGFVDLATWEKIPFQYGSKILRAVAERQARAREPERFARLHKVIQYELGHDVAFAVENAKISANAQAGEGARVKLGFVEPGLGAEFGLADKDASLA